MHPATIMRAFAASVIAAAATAVSIPGGATPDATAGDRYPVTCTIRIKEIDPRDDGEARVIGRTHTALDGARFSHANWWLRLPELPDAASLRQSIEPVHMASCVRNAELTTGDGFDREDVRTRFRGEPSRYR